VDAITLNATRKIKTPFVVFAFHLKNIPLFRAPPRYPQNQITLTETQDAPGVDEIRNQRSLLSLYMTTVF
jgi:hypothetical protein